MRWLLPGLAAASCWAGDLTYGRCCHTRGHDSRCFSRHEDGTPEAVRAVWSTSGGCTLSGSTSAKVKAAKKKEKNFHKILVRFTKVP